MWPLKCFRSSKVGHLAIRCLKRGPRQKFKKFNKKAYYVNEDTSISDDKLEGEDYLFYADEDEEH